MALAIPYQLYISHLLAIFQKVFLARAPYPLLALPLQGVYTHFQGDSDFMSRENCELVIRRIYVMPRLGHVYFLHDLASMP